MKRYCQTLELRDDREMIERYVEAHAHVWPEIQEGIRSVGILDMQIYTHGNRLFMICDTTDDFDWEKDNARLATLPRQAECALDGQVATDGTDIQASRKLEA